MLEALNPSAENVQGLLHSRGPGTWMLELMLRHVSPAESHLWMPTVLSRCAIWRCRLLSSTASWSAMPSLPTPAAARYIATGLPRPPAPMTRTEELQRRDCAAHSKPPLGTWLSLHSTLEHGMAAADPLRYIQLHMT